MLVEELYPADLPDLFAGSGLLLTGRFRNLESEDGEVAVTLRGRAEGEMRVYTKTVSMLDEGQATAVQQAVPRLWAARKIGHLLTQIRLQGENPEWIQAVIDLSIQYGVMTPYTSFLIKEEDILTMESRENAVEKWLSAEESPPAVGSEAVSQAEAEGVLRDAEAVPDPGLAWLDGEEGEQRPILRQAGMKTFLLQGEFWVDTAYVPERMTPREILFGSGGYFRMLDDHPHWGIYYALGSQVIFVDGEEAYRIKEDGEVAEISRHGQSHRAVALPPQDEDTLLLTACGVSLLTGGVLWKTVRGQLRGDRG
jgi:Ca-activated chloride channel family protein